MIIRQETPEDVNEIKNVNDLAFQQEDESVLIHKLRESEAFIPELSLVAVRENKVVGHILFTRIHIESETHSTLSLALAPMAVHPDFQKQGIGTAMVEQGLKKAQSLGYKSVVVLGHDQYYPKFGFKKANDFGVKAPFEEVPEEAFMVNELEEGSLQNVEGKVRYSEPFME